MNYYNNNYIQKRNAERNSKIFGKEMAETSHYKEIRNAVNSCAYEIASKFGLSEITAKNIASLIYCDSEMGVEVFKRITFLMNVLEKYGYTDEEAINVIDSNFSLIQQPSINLIHNLSIANQYGFDEELLVNNAKFSSINEKSLYALIEELKSNGLDVIPENILKLNIQIKKDHKMSNLIKLHPLEKKDIYKYRTLYERSMKERENEKAITKVK